MSCVVVLVASCWRRNCCSKVVISLCGRNAATKGPSPKCFCCGANRKCTMVVTKVWFKMLSSNVGSMVFRVLQRSLVRKSGVSLFLLALKWIQISGRSSSGWRPHQPNRLYLTGRLIRSVARESLVAWWSRSCCARAAIVVVDVCWCSIIGWKKPEMRRAVSASMFAVVVVSVFCSGRRRRKFSSRALSLRRASARSAGVRATSRCSPNGGCQSSIWDTIKSQAVLWM